MSAARRTFADDRRDTEDAERPGNRAESEHHGRSIGANAILGPVGIAVFVLVLLLAGNWVIERRNPAPAPTVTYEARVEGHQVVLVFSPEPVVGPFRRLRRGKRFR